MGILSSELRIGNLVALSGSLNLTVYEIHEDCYYAKDANGSSFKNTWADLKPIPLSEEVLLKCGFEKARSNYEEAETFDFFRGFIWFDMANQSTKLCRKYALGFVPEYLHQLQNLYYALCGEELEVKLSD